MDRNETRRFDEMLAEFRALGGTADNVRLGDGPLGRGLFPVHLSMPVRVHVPESLLLDATYIDVSDGSFRVAADAPIGAREKAFLENYERDFSWGPGNQDTRELLQLVQDAPEALRAFLKMPLDVSTWLAGADLPAVTERFFSSRVFGYKGKRVVMPVVELINHGSGTQYDDSKGLRVSGTFAGEVLVRYGDYDPLDLFATWGFASANESIAFSLNLRVDTPHGPLVVRQDAFPKNSDREPFVPQVLMDDGELTLSHVLLGHKEAPWLPRRIFYDVLRKAGRRGAAETFEILQHVNRQQFYRLDALSDMAAPALARLLREVARYQLECMSHHIGTRGEQETK